MRAVAQIYKRLLEVKPTGQTINVCSGKTHSLREVLTMVKNISGYEIEVKVNPAFVRANDVKILCGDSTRLQSLIGNCDSPSLEDTLRWMMTADA